MPKTTSKAEINVQVNIKPVKLGEAPAYQQMLVKKFWSRVFAQAQDEVNNGKPTT